MMKIFIYLYLLVGIIEFAQPTSRFTCYFQAVTEVENVMKESGDLQGYADADIKYIEEQMDNIPDRNFKLLTGLLIADYYINKEYEKYPDIVNPSIDSLVNDNIKKAADYISDFMIEYMDYESINKYIIKPKEGLEPFGDYMKSVNASVVLKDIEDAIIEYYFPELKTDTALPSSKLRDSEGEGLQVNQNPSKQIEQDRGLKRKADKVNLTKSSEEIESNIENKLEQKQTWGEWLYSWGKWLLGK